MLILKSIRNSRTFQLYKGILINVFKSNRVSWLALFIVFTILIQVLPFNVNRQNITLCQEYEVEVSYDDVFISRPYNYTGQHKDVASFVERATSYGGMVYILPEFNNSTEIKNDDLILALTLTSITPRIGSGAITAHDLQQTAKMLFGPNVGNVEHKTIGPHEWHSAEQVYKPIAHGPIAHTTAHVLNVIETELEYIVYAAHMIRYSYYDYETMKEVYYIHDEYDNLVVDFTDEVDYSTGHLPAEEDILDYLPQFPVRRYTLKKTGHSYFISRAETLGVLAPVGAQPISNLRIGDRVVDPSWEWEYKAGVYYSDISRFDDPLPPGEIKPVTWIVVAKDHYGIGSGVTLLSEEVIARFPFDNSTGRVPGVTYHSGYNHWGESGTGNATYGLRPWLNSTGIHSGEGFYRAFSDTFKAAVVTVSIPNRHWETGAEYYTSDRVFIPSTTEFGDTEHREVHRVGSAYPYFQGAVNADRIAYISGIPTWYWARSPGYDSIGSISMINGDLEGSIGVFHADDSRSGPRPALNLNPNTLVSQSSDQDGVYVIKQESEEIDGTHRVLYVPVKFAGDEGPQPERSISELKALAGFVTHYFKQQTYNNIDIASDFINDDWIELPNTYQHYETVSLDCNNWWCFGNTIINDVLRLIDINTDDYDTILIIQPAKLRAFASPTVGLAIVDQYDSYGVWAHEMGHTLKKWPDYYYEAERVDTRGVVNAWCLMGSGTHLNPPAPIMSFNKVLEGWLSYKDIQRQEYGRYDVDYLHDLAYGDKIHRYIPGEGLTDYFIIEGRNPGQEESLIEADPFSNRRNRIDLRNGIKLYYQIERSRINEETGYEIYETFIYSIPYKLNRDNVVTLPPNHALYCDLNEVAFSVTEEGQQLYVDISENKPVDRKIIVLRYVDYHKIGILLDSVPIAAESVMKNAFDVDLKVYDNENRKVGMCYDTDEYLLEIPGARAIGNIPGAGPEWVSVPDDIDIYYEIDTTPLEMWLDELFEMGIIDSKNIDLESIKVAATIQEITVDEKGERSVTEKIELIEVAYEFPVESENVSNDIMVMLALLFIALVLIVVLARKIILR